MTTSHDHRYALPPGHHLGEYRIDRYLGSGGFGITYLATDENLNLQVAIKEYLPSDLAMRDADNSVVVKTAEDEDDFEWGRERFLDEARSLARFNHPNIVRVQRFFEAHGTSYIVMDYVEGEPLSGLLERKGTLTEAEIHQFVLPLANGLAVIHEAGLLHRDIKPSNIIIRDDGTSVLIDFGSARQAVGMKSRSVTSVVTPGYAPLEQYATKSRQGPATDIYAFGAVLYRCATGKAPVDATERAIEDELTPATRAVRDSFNPSLLAAIDAALALRMEERPENTAALMGALGDSGQANARVANRHFDTTSSSNQSEHSTNSTSGKTAGKSPLWRAMTANFHLPFTALLVLVTLFKYTHSHGSTQPSGSIQPPSLIASDTGWGHDSTQRNGSMQPVESNGAAERKADAQAKAMQEDLAFAVNAYEREDYTTALPRLQRLAERGEATAQFYLGTMYSAGSGLPKAATQAAIFYRKAALQGFAEAQYLLGVSYANGEGVARDDALAVVWWHKAAEQGLAVAQNALGGAYAVGYGVSQDYVDAYAWLIVAANSGHQEAQSVISRILPHMTAEQFSSGVAASIEIERDIKAAQ